MTHEADRGLAEERAASVVPVIPDVGGRAPGVPRRRIVTPVRAVSPQPVNDVADLTKRRTNAAFTHYSPPPSDARDKGYDAVDFDHVSSANANITVDPGNLYYFTLPPAEAKLAKDVVPTEPTPRRIDEVVRQFHEGIHSHELGLTLGVHQAILAHDTEARRQIEAVNKVIISETLKSALATTKRDGILPRILKALMANDFGITSEEIFAMCVDLGIAQGALAPVTRLNAKLEEANEEHEIRLVEIDKDNYVIAVDGVQWTSIRQKTVIISDDDAIKIANDVSPESTASTGETQKEADLRITDPDAFYALEAAKLSVDDQLAAVREGYRKPVEDSPTSPDLQQSSIV